MTRDPDISVVMVVFNSERYILESINSILGQTFESFECIVIDDGSTDRTVEIVQTVKDPRVQLVRKEHLGLTAQLNTALRLARAPIIARMDSGDVAAPERLRLQLECFSDPAVGVVSCSYDVIDGEGRYLATRRLPDTDAEIRYHLPVFSTICHAGACYRRDLVLREGGYNEREFPVAQDLDLWFRLLPHTKFRNRRESLMSCRTLSTSVSRAHGERQRAVHLRLGLRHLDAERARIGNHGDQGEVLLQMARCHYYNGTTRDARNILRRLLLTHPRKAVVVRYWVPALLGERILRALRSSGWAERSTRFLKRGRGSWKYFSP